MAYTQGNGDTGWSLVQPREESTITPYLLTLALNLSLFWLLLSGHFHDPLLLTLGALSVLLSLWVTHRVECCHPDRLSPRLLLHLPGYLFWLLGQVVRANRDMVARIWSPKIPISPVMIRVPAAGHGTMGRVVYANSITLTPGTVTLEMDDDGLLVHALTRQAAEELKAGEMARRVDRLELPA